MHYLLLLNFWLNNIQSALKQFQMENVPEDGEESAMPFHYMGRHK